MNEKVEKPLEDYSEEEIKEMFLDMFLYIFWIAENRSEWLQEAISRRRKQTEGKELK